MTWWKHCLAILVGVIFVILAGTVTAAIMGALFFIAPLILTSSSLHVLAIALAIVFYGFIAIMVGGLVIAVAWAIGLGILGWDDYLND